MAKTKSEYLSKKRHAQALIDLAALQRVADLRKNKKRVSAVRMLMKEQKEALAKGAV